MALNSGNSQATEAVRLKAEAPSAPETRAALWAKVLIWVVPALWSTNYLVARSAQGVIGPHTLALGRWAVAALLMAPFVWRGLAQDGGRAWRAEWPHALMLGGLGMWICGAWVYIAGHTTTTTNIALIYAVTPVAIVALSAQRAHERMSRGQWLGVVMALAGVVFVIAKGDVLNLLQVRLTPGDGWIVGAAAAWTAYSVLLRQWPTQLGPAQRLWLIILGGVAFLLPFTLLEWWLVPQPPLGAKALGLVLVAAVIPGLLSYTAHSYLQRELGASRTAVMLYLAPVYGALGSWLVLGEPPHWYHAVGAALILPSIAFATRR